MSDRKSLIQRILDRLAGGESLIRVPSSNMKADQKALGKAFSSRNEKITIAKDPDGGALWVKRKKSD
jgi:hypothetical protein